MWLPAIALLGKHPTATAKGVLVELAGPLMLAQLPQIVGEVVGRAQGVGVVLAEHPAAVGEGVLVKLAGLCILPSARRSRARLLADSRVSGSSVPSTRRRSVSARSNRGGRHRGLPGCAGRSRPGRVTRGRPHRPAPGAGVGHG